MAWLRPDGSEMTPENWTDGGARAFAVQLDGRAQATGLHRRGGDATLLIMFNAYHDLVTFTLPESVGGVAWTRLLDTNLPDSQDVESFPFGSGYAVTGRSLLMFVLKPEDSPGDGDNAMERSYQHVMQAFERRMSNRPLPPRRGGLRGRAGVFATPGLACLARGGAPG